MTDFRVMYRVSVNADASSIFLVRPQSWDRYRLWPASQLVVMNSPKTSHKDFLCNAKHACSRPTPAGCEFAQFCLQGMAGLATAGSVRFCSHNPTHRAFVESECRKFTLRSDWQ